MRACLAFAIGAVLLTTTPVTAAPKAGAPARKGDARDHLAKAAAAYKDGNWQAVLDELGAAYQIAPDPSLHFSMGQVYVKMGRCRDAIDAYQKFIDSGPTEDRAQVAHEAIDSCQAKLAAEPPPPPPPPPEPVRPPPPPPPSHGTDDHWYRDRVGVSLVGGGAALLVASAVMYGLARSDLSDAENAPTYAEQDAAYSSARSKRTVSVVFALGGLAVGGVGAYHYYRKRQPRDGVAVIPTRDGGWITWAGRF